MIYRNICLKFLELFYIFFSGRKNNLIFWFSFQNRNVFVTYNGNIILNAFWVITVITQHAACKNCLFFYSYVSTRTMVPLKKKYLCNIFFYQRKYERKFLVYAFLYVRARWRQLFRRIFMVMINERAVIVKRCSSGKYKFIKCVFYFNGFILFHYSGPPQLPRNRTIIIIIIVLRSVFSYVYRSKK